MKVHLVFTIMFLLFVPLLAKDVLQGFVKDSANGKPIGLVKVKCLAPACSTFTDASGNYTLSIDLPTNILPSRQNDRLRVLTWNGVTGSFSSPGISEYVIEVSNSLGRRLAIYSSSRQSVKQLSMGEYFATYQIGEMKGCFKFLNFPGKSQRILINEAFLNQPMLAKAAATSYTVVCTVAGYIPASKSIIPGTATEILLAPQKTSANSNIVLDTLGGVKIKVEIVPPDTTVKSQKN